jgi:putative glutamine amidotransferase
MSRPLIGVSCRLHKTEIGDWFYLQKEYTEAVWAHGGLPVQVPLIADPAYTAQLVERLDGIVLSGSSSDVDPPLYGAQRQEKCGPVHPEKDAVDIEFVKLALKTGKPLLGICFGTQAMNVALGGTLIQHLETKLAHPDSTPDRRNRHTVRLESDSVLARLAGGASESRVNCSHHQALDRVAPSLRVTARASDGVIEAVESAENGRFLVGVQWHPERIWGENDLSRALFEELIRQSSGGTK